MIKNKKTYESIYDLVDEILERVVAEPEHLVHVLADYDDVKEIITTMICLTDGEINLESVEIGSAEFMDYDGPWLLCLDDEYNLFCERAIREGKNEFLGFEGYLYTRECYVNKALERAWIDGYTIYSFEYEVEHDDKDESQVCFDWDEDRQGFVFCTCVGGTQQKFRYRGTTKLDEETALNIVNAYLG